MNKQKQYKALLLAGHRHKTNEISSAYGMRYKALVPVAGQAMIMHPLTSLQASDNITDIIVLSQEPELLKSALQEYELSGRVKFQEGRHGIADSILNLPEQGEALLVTTADNCLLTSDHISAFIDATEEHHAEVCIGAVEKNKLLSHYPESRRTWIRFKDKEISGCNLFLLNGKHARQAVEFWKDFENSPKKLIKLAWRLGPMVCWRYWRGRLCIDEAFEAISAVTGVRIRPVFMQNPQIAIDADKLSDIEQIEMIIKDSTRHAEAAPANNGSSKTVVIFDLDRTITTFGTYAPFLLYYALRHNPLRLVFTPVIILHAILYALKLTSRKQLKTGMFKLLIGRPRQTEIISAAAAYVEQTLSKKVYREALELIQEWHNKKAQLVLATASYDWLAEVFGRRLGFDQVVATRSLQQQGIIIAGIDGENCYGSDKLAMVSAAIGPLNGLIAAGREVWCYTDHHSDISLLSECSHPVGVNPTKKLSRWLETRPNALKLSWERTIGNEPGAGNN